MPSKFLALFLMGLFSSSISWGAPHKTKSKPSPAVTEKDAKKSEEGDGLFDNLNKEKSISIILGVMDLIMRNYVEVVDLKKLLLGTLNGMLGNLDPHSRFCVKEEFNRMCEEVKGEFGGLGMEVTMENGFVKIISPIDGTPAALSGLKGQDLIVAIDGIPLTGMSLFDSVKKMRGAPGTNVTLLIKRDGVSKPFLVTLTRAIIQVKSVKWHIEPGDVGYIRIATFDEKIAELLAQAIKDIKAKLGNKLKGFVVDVRNNPGGRFDQAVAAVNLFVDRGVIVSMKGRKPEHQAVFKAEPDKMIADDYPVVVLINQGSASASEILAGALQDHKRAILMGEPSFGKGSVQIMMPLGADGKNGGITLTIARFYTPSGTAIQSKGITPDVLIEPLQGVKGGDAPLIELREKNLPGCLSNVSTSEEATSLKEAAESKDTKGKDGKESKDAKATAAQLQDKANGVAAGAKEEKCSVAVAQAEEKEKDYQLMRAVETVMALYIYKQSLQGSPDASKTK
jgi:carboxyl-terminal processing protease